MFIHALLGLSARLINWGPENHAPVLDDDGACPVCDHPFGDLSHMCVGAVTRMAA